MITMTNSENNPSDEIIGITTIKDYLIELSDFFKINPKKYSQHHYFYRGQRKDTPEVLPSLIRDNMFASEVQIINQAYGRRPLIFKEQNSSFERLTKLQHYGLKTRLLDLTLNPLVALFFACDGDEDKDGVVYIYDADSFDYNSKEVLIHAAISEMEIINGIYIQDLLIELKDKGIISSLDLEKYRENNCERFKKILKGEYFVISNLSNDRLIQQSGAFFIPGCIEIAEEENPEKCSIHKVKKVGVEKYLLIKYRIPWNKKKDLLEELDLYNINRASLFPELDYQMRYINEMHCKTEFDSSKKPDVDFSKESEENYEEEKYETKPDELIDEPEKALPEATIITDKDETDESVIWSSVKKWTPPTISQELVFNIFKENMIIDWYKKDQVISKIRKEVNRSIDDSMRYTSDGSEKWANVIVNMVMSDFNEYLQRKEENNKSQ